MIFAATLVLGWLLGCVGAGGAGLTITLLTVGFGLPIHTAIAVSLSCMTFTVASGAFSHYREGEVLVRLGATAIMLLLTTALLYLQLFRGHLIKDYVERNKSTATGSVFYLRSCIIGLLTGFLSGAFGIGATAFIQISLMLFFGISLYHAIGTTMMIILPIAISGGLSYLFNGMMDPVVFIQTLAGLTIGSFIGAKFTHLIPKDILRCLMISMPLIGGVLLLTN